MEVLMEVFSYFTFGIALLGAVLGIINTWRNVNRDRIRLRVTPKQAIPIGGIEGIYSNIDFCIEVVNLSYFPLTVDEVGFFHKGTDRRSVAIEPITLDETKIPRKIEAREAVTFYMQRPNRLEGSSVKSAYAKTSCGYVFVGKSPALNSVHR